MTLRSFLHYVELRTKVASVIPFFFGTLYAYWGYGQFNLMNMLLMLISLISIDMATTASNHYTDYHRAIQREGYNYESHNTIVRDNLSPRKAFGVIAGLVAIGIVSGLILVMGTDLLVLVIGGVSFAVGLLYSWGPLPLSRSPFSEAVSGFFMGFVIVFLSVYIHLQTPGWITVGLNGHRVALEIDIYQCFRLLMVSSPLIFGISNIMLSNNLCDMEEDKVNGRLTLPILMGRQWGILLSKALYASMYVGIMLSLVLKWIPVTCGLVFLTMPHVYKASAIFSDRQSKAETFVISVKNFLLVALTYCLGLGIGVWLL